ncbi:pentatricopeptide repeat domain-containing protein [Besnoitia besnoiti]|uniref:Pentatricopeptide repeat domain-containing protein n=1 Tax=Besnoitia besnoiti TaxID=94643 RepID=A0A2A9M4B9_BESBE|nr:pentatricopeptide repeat domain-containing protein [Besnoitia besnoiti]PFH31151.1 pentatricopeptide repeat domain-containing protein [Besnoitia besnoiti]
MARAESSAALALLGDSKQTAEGVSLASAKATALLDQLLQGLGGEEKDVAGVVLQHCLSALESEALTEQADAAGASGSAKVPAEGADKLGTSASVEKELLLSAAAALRHHFRPSDSRPASARDAASYAHPGPCCASCSSPVCRRAGAGSERTGAIPALCECACAAAKQRVISAARTATAVAGACVAPETQAKVFALVSTAAGAAATAAAAAATASPDFASAASTVASNLICAAVRAQLKAKPPSGAAPPDSSVTVLASIIASLYGADSSSAAEAGAATAEASESPGKALEKSPQALPIPVRRENDRVAEEDASHFPLPVSTLRVLLSHAENTRDEELLLLLLAIAQHSSPAPRSAGSSPRHLSNELARAAAREALPVCAEGTQCSALSGGDRKTRPYLTFSDSSAVVVRGVGAANATWRGFCIGAGRDGADASETFEKADSKNAASNGGAECQSKVAKKCGIDVEKALQVSGVPFKTGIFAPTDDDKALGDECSVAATRTSTMNDGGNVPVTVSFSACGYGATVSTMTSDDYWGEEGQYGTAFPVLDVKETSRLKKEGVSQVGAAVATASGDPVVLSLTTDGVSTSSCCSSELSSVAASSFTCVCGRAACQLCGSSEDPLRAGTAEATAEHISLVELLRKAQCQPPPGLSIGAGCRAAVENRLAADVCRAAAGREQTPPKRDVERRAGPGQQETPDATPEAQEPKRNSAEDGELLAAAALLRTLSLRCNGESDVSGAVPQLSEADTDLARRFLHLLQTCTQAQHLAKASPGGRTELANGSDSTETAAATEAAPLGQAEAGAVVDREVPKNDASSTEAHSAADSGVHAGAAVAGSQAMSGGGNSGGHSKPVPLATEAAAAASASAAQGLPGEEASRTALQAASQEDVSGAPRIGGWPEERTGDDVYRYGVLLRHLGRTGKVKACWTVWSKLKNTKGRASSTLRLRFERILLASAQKWRSEETPASLLFVLAGLQPNAVAYGCMYDALVSNGRVVEALELFEEMKREGQIQPNTIMYSTIIKGFAQAKQLDRALKMYAEMQENGVAINTVTFNSIVDACARVGAMDKAAMLLEDMLSQGIKPDLITFSTIIKGYCVHGEMNKALHLLTAMRERQIKPDGVLYNSLLDGCVKTGRVSLCEYLWEEMQREDIAPSNFTLTILIKMHGRLYQLQKAFDLVKELPRKYGFSINAHVYTCLMAACIVNREYTLALEVYDCMERDGVRGDPKTLSTIVGGCVKGRMIREAVRIVDRALDQMAPPSAAAPHSHGGDVGVSPHTGPALVDEKTLRFIVQQTKAHGLGEELGLPLVHKAIGVGLLRGRNAAAAFHSLGNSSTQALSSFCSGSALGGLRQRNAGRFAGDAPPPCHRRQGYGFDGKNGNMVSAYHGEAEANWQSVSGPAASHHAQMSSRAGAPASGHPGGRFSQRHPRDAVEDSFFSASFEALPSVRTHAPSDLNCTGRKACGGHVERRPADAGAASAGWRGEGRAESAWWSGGGGAQRGASDLSAPEAAPLNARLHESCLGGGCAVVRGGASAAVRGGQERQVQGSAGCGGDGFFLPTLLNVHLADAGEVSGSSAQTVLEETVAGRLRGGAAADGQAGGSCGSHAADARGFGARALPPGLGDSEMFKSGQRRFLCGGGVGPFGASTAAFAAPSQQQQVSSTAVEDGVASFLCAREQLLAGSSAQDNFGYFSAAARPLACGKDKGGRQQPEPRRLGGHTFLSGPDCAAASHAAGRVFAEPSPVCSNWVGGGADGQCAAEPQRGAAAGSCAERVRPSIHAQPQLPPYCGAGSAVCESPGGSGGSGMGAAAGRRRRHAPGQYMWKPEGKPVQKESC